MNILMNAFGENCFSLSNSVSGLCCDCDSNRVIISASGEETSVDQQGVINITQGSTATLQAIGFPLLADDITYTWYVLVNGSRITGSAVAPYIQFGHNRLHYSTGELIADEHSSVPVTYTVYTENSNFATG